MSVRAIMLLTAVAGIGTTNVSYAQNPEAPPTVSLFLTPEEYKEAEILAQRIQPAGKGDVHLGAILYFGKDDWSVWLQGEKHTPETARDDIRILKVTPQNVTLSVSPDDGSTPIDVTLAPNQSYRISTKKIISGP